MTETDLELLARYNLRKAEDAFAEIVRRHVDLVHSAALRQVRSPQLAEEVAQSTFINLARHAHRLAPDTVLAAWLYQVTRREAIDVIRREARRQVREQLATEMTAMNTPSDWTRIEPVLDEAMEALDDADRSALLLRYFENKSLREVGAALGTSDDAAQKRVSRAVDRLRDAFVKRGIAVGTSGLIAALSSHAVQAAPIGVTGTISTAALLSGTTLKTSTTLTAAKTIAMTIPQKTLVATSFVVLLGLGVHLFHHTLGLDHQVRWLKRQQAPLEERLEETERERDEANDQLARLTGDLARAKQEAAELLKLRGETASLRSRLIARESDYEKLAAETVHGQLRPRSDWADKGNQEPFAAVETMLWAFSQNQRTRLEDTVTAQALADSRSSLFPMEHPPVQTVGAVNLISTTQNQEGTRAVVTAFVREDFIAPPGGTAYSIRKLQGWQLVKRDGGWRVSKHLFFDLGRD